MKKIAFATLKGGAGKTMNIFNLAGVLAEKKKVLLIDVDPQCNLSNNCGLDSAESESIITIYDVFSNYLNGKQPKPEDVIIKAPISSLPKLDLLPSSIQLFEAEDSLTGLREKTYILNAYISANIEVFEKYDYILIDTNPSMSCFNTNAFYAADDIVLCTDVSFNGAKGAEMFCGLWDRRREKIKAELDDEKEDNISALIIGNYDKRLSLATELKEYLSEAEWAEGILLDTLIPARKDLKESEISFETINKTAEGSDAAAAFRALAKELKKKGVL